MVIATVVTDTSARPHPRHAFRPPKVIQELRQAQRSDGLSLLTVKKGAIWYHDFQSGKLRELLKLPAELAGYPEDWDHLENNSLNWKESKFAGMGQHGLFVADLASGKVRWYRNVFGSHRMSLDHKANCLAFQSFGYVYVLDLVTGKFTEFGAGMNENTVPQWSEDDSQLLFHKWSPSDPAPNPGTIFVADAKTGQRRVLAEGFDASWVPKSGEVTFTRIGPWYSPLTRWTSSPDNQNPRRTGETDGLGGPLCYSPDGKYAVYQRGWTWDINIKGHQYGEVAVVRSGDRKVATVYGPFKRASWTRGDALPLTWAYVK
jgi:hypothetical protein